jgi:hypothetical protein
MFKNFTEFVHNKYNKNQNNGININRIIAYYGDRGRIIKNNRE